MAGARRDYPLPKNLSKSQSVATGCEDSLPAGCSQSGSQIAASGKFDRVLSFAPGARCKSFLAHGLSCGGGAKSSGFRPGGGAKRSPGGAKLVRHFKVPRQLSKAPPPAFAHLMRFGFAQPRQFAAMTRCSKLLGVGFEHVSRFGYRLQLRPSARSGSAGRSMLRQKLRANSLWLIVSYMNQ